MRLPDISNKSFAQISTHIGDLYLFEIRVKETISLEKKLYVSSLADIQSEAFLKLYLPFFAYLKKDLNDSELERPDEYCLQVDDVEKLSNAELEEIAKSFIEKHSYLYKEYESSSSKKEDGTPVISFNQKTVDSLLKANDESYIDYFHRLFVEQERKNKEQFLKMASSFSTGLASDIFKTYNFGKTLTDQISSISKIAESSTSSFLSSFQEKKPISANFEAIKPNYHIPDFAELHRQQEKNRLAPFKDLSSKMEAMIDAEKKTVEFMSSVYTTQVEIANELKSSSDSAGAYAKKNVFFTRVIIGLTVVSTFITAATFAYPIWFDKKDKETLQVSKGLNTTMAQTNVKLEELIHVMSAQNDVKEQQITELQKKLVLEKEKTNKLLKKIGVKK